MGWFRSWENLVTRGLSSEFELGFFLVSWVLHCRSPSVIEAATAASTCSSRTTDSALGNLVAAVEAESLAGNRRDLARKLCRL
ncbi:uncharacterized protein BDW70DRAFT_125797 [Aspergillus foveolatus]|uniref:uncharacterized protein n=1 Tax=Aspergillus foveolatus TaxID=210207 RepID=UPI003CCD0AC9